MLKVMTLVGTRPELIKMSRVIAELDDNVEHILVHSGQNYDYELNQVFFDDLGIRKPDFFLNISHDSVAESIADVIKKSDDLFEKLKPDALLLYGDTNTCLAVIAAKRRKIPVFHMEAGNRCFDQRVPEELNRKVVDHLSDINLVLTERAREYLIREGIPPHMIIKTGSHMKEVLEHYLPQIEQSDILERAKLKKGQYFLVSAHREENVDSDEHLQNLIDSLNQLIETYQYPIYFSTHPRTKKRLEQVIGSSFHPLIHFSKPLGFFDFVKLQLSAACILSDSGTITEEASILNLPAVTIRNSHERPEGMDEGTLIMSGLQAQSVLRAVAVVIKQHGVSKDRLFKLVPDYDVDFVSKKILRIILSHIEYINQFIWHKN